MDIKQSARVSCSPNEVWAMLGNVPMVVACIPGAELGEALGANRYRGSFKLKVGPLFAKIDGEGHVERNEGNRSARIVGRGVDKRGGSRVSATVDYKVVPNDAGSIIEISADVDLSGPLAQIGRTSIINDVAKRLTEEFSVALEKYLDASREAQVAEVVDGDRPAVVTEHDTRQFDVGRAFGLSIWTRLKSFIKRLLNF